MKRKPADLLTAILLAKLEQDSAHSVQLQPCTEQKVSNKSADFMRLMRGIISLDNGGFLNP